MAQQHLEPTNPGPRSGSGTVGHVGPATGDALAAYLRAQATEFLRALRQHRESGGAAAGAEDQVDAARALRLGSAFAVLAQGAEELRGLGPQIAREGVPGRRPEVPGHGFRRFKVLLCHAGASGRL